MDEVKPNKQVMQPGRKSVSIFVEYEKRIRSGSSLYYKVVQIWPGLFVCKQVTVCPGHI
jgi:hypothetical protein